MPAMSANRPQPARRFSIRFASLPRLPPLRGNIDVYGPCAHLPATEVVTLHGHTFYMLHDRHALDLDPVAAGFSAVISGHSHRPLIEWNRDVLYMNPGSAGPRRFSLPVSLGFLTYMRVGSNHSW